MTISTQLVASRVVGKGVSADTPFAKSASIRDIQSGNYLKIDGYAVLVDGLRIKFEEN